ncbi:hypothetical protein EJ04DRAFT_516917 [Polyplosphaeria fusca]|uniref:Uncharacterized protein n=1 Tax=Polyplosphaeria fusca TaxID=682080 RepID=A0A9P4QLQ1_9PLEO|nr:hypothetical protein EJ04DRAFT_516917 [Polyplosphaeria fusca]
MTTTHQVTTATGHMSSLGLACLAKLSRGVQRAGAMQDSLLAMVREAWFLRECRAKQSPRFVSRGKWSAARGWAEKMGAWRRLNAIPDTMSKVHTLLAVIISGFEQNEIKIIQLTPTPSKGAGRQVIVADSSPGKPHEFCGPSLVKDHDAFRTRASCTAETISDL